MPDASYLPAVPFDQEPGPVIEGSLVAARGAVLVVDDVRADAARAAQGLGGLGLEVDVVTSLELAREHLAERDYALVVTELFPGEAGPNMVEAAAAKADLTQVVVLTGRGTATDAVFAMNQGALYYLTKPVRPAELRAVVHRALRHGTLERRTIELERRLDNRFGFDAIVGDSPAMQAVFKRLRQVAPTQATVLVTGETGTGKELIAKTIHQNSRRSKGPFIAVNCGALPESMVESELFGHEKGAFTGAMHQRKGRFEAANGGTLFLDEIGDTPPGTQIRLLRALEEREIVRVGSNLPVKVDVRLIAATNVDLKLAVEEGRFREDLYYRLRVVALRLPPLRERPQDLLPLITRFVGELGRKYHKTIDGMTPEVRRVLNGYAWPGNVRQLRSTIEEMVITSTTPLLDVDALPPELAEAEIAPRSAQSLAGASLEDMERELIRQTLDLTDGNREQAAKILKIGERTLYRKIKKFDLR